MIALGILQQQMQTDISIELSVYDFNIFFLSVIIVNKSISMKKIDMIFCFS